MECRVFWFNGLLHWDFGVSSINGQLISEQLKEVFPATMELCILAFGFALMVGIPVGMLAGVTRSKWPDRFISALALLGFSIPVSGWPFCSHCSFRSRWGGCRYPGALTCFMKLNRLPVSPSLMRISDSPWRDEMVMSAIRHMVLPVLTLSSRRPQK